jgi:TonB family protein
MAAQPQQQTNKNEEDIVTQNDDEAPAIEKPKNTKPRQEKPAEEPKPTVNQRALFKGNNNPQSGGSEGITGQPGDQGNPNGLAGIKKYDGQGGKGNGTGYDLGGRGAKSLHRPNDDFSEEGIVVVDIWVNRQGKVTRAEVATKGTTVINSDMRQKATQAALRSSFAADPNAPEEQHGTITYTFVINQ